MGPPPLFTSHFAKISILEQKYFSSRIANDNGVCPSKSSIFVHIGKCYSKYLNILISSLITAKCIRFRNLFSSVEGFILLFILH